MSANHSRSQLLSIALATLLFLSLAVIRTTNLDYSLSSTVSNYYVQEDDRNESWPIISYGSNQSNITPDEINVLCLVMSRPSGKRQQDTIVDTWGKGCTDLVFLMGESTTDSDMFIELKPHVYMLIVPVEDAWGNTWIKLRAALKFIKNRWNDDFDWLLRIDDDAFVIFDNLRRFLSTLDPSAPLQLGALYVNYAGGYIGTGPGIVISRAGFHTMMENINNHSLCNTNAKTHADDVELGNCLKNSGVPYGNSSDSLGRPRFIPISLEDLLFFPNAPNHGFFETYSAYPVKKGLNCCSDDLISLHYVSPEAIHNYYQIVQAHPKEKKSLRLLLSNWNKALKQTETAWKRGINMTSKAILTSFDPSGWKGVGANFTQ